MEDNIIAAYKACKQQQGVTGITVKCGFCISKHHGFLGASPDGLVHDPSTENTEGLIKLKYIQVEEHESQEDALIRKGICKKYEDGVKLNVKHKYYFQIQQVMSVVERIWTDFVVMGTGCATSFCERVSFSKDFWDTIFPKLE